MTKPKIDRVGRQLQMIDLFAGCGGLTHGFVSTGRFETVAAVEMDLHAAATYAENFGNHVHVGDIADWAQGSIPRADVVIGGPPCQGFSALGRQDPADPRNQLWRHYVSVLRRARPAIFVLENVPQFLKSHEFSLLQAETKSRGALADYAIEPYLLSADSYGVGQRRRRAVVIGRRRELDEIGMPQEQEPQTLRDAFPEWLSVRVTETELPDSAIEFAGSQVPGVFKLPDLHVTRRPTALSLARFRAIPPGGSRRDLPDELKTECWRKHKSGAGDVMGRLNWDAPSVTIRTEFFKPEKGRYLHPTEHRPITHAEAALIQGFQEDFVWCGTKTSIARQIGNAVPPPLAAAIARQLEMRID